MIKFLKQATHLGRLMLAEFVAGAVANEVERILADRKAAHVHKPRMVYDPGLPVSELDWAVGLRSVNTGEKHKLGFDILRTTAGLRVCGICGEVYYDEVKP